MKSIRQSFAGRMRWKELSVFFPRPVHFLMFCFFSVMLFFSVSHGYGQEETPQDISPAIPLIRGYSDGSITELPTNQIIIKYKSGYKPNVMPAQADQIQRLTGAAGVELMYFREMSGDAHVLRLTERLPMENVRQIAQQLASLPEVEYAEPDRIYRPALTPNDPQYSSQWHYYDTYGIHAPGAWDITTGSSSIVAAVIDTGILNHADLSGRTVGGYDFISDVWTANDGDGRDSNPSDPGDWVAAGDCGVGEPAESSSWHGTHVAGTIGAASNNSLGVTGINWVSKILPVRVLGRCGGYDSDIADAIRWAAGLSVSGVPANANPARVLNLSLSGYGSCTSTFQNAINAAYSAGAVIVVAAGNNNSLASNYAPGNCANVITVAATTRSGNRASYSNYGSAVEISAPGGDSIGGGVLSTSNTGTTVPASDAYYYYQGTSMATPHVVGVVSLMLSRNPFLTPAQVLTILQNTAQPFPAGSTCSATNCGSGIVNAAGAVANAIPISDKYRFYLPLISRYLPEWAIIKSETFEGSFPNTWSVFDNDDSTNGTYYWAKKNCMAYQGSYSAWAVGGGANGSALSCGASYPNYVKSWMKYGPFSLTDAIQAELRYQLWLNSETGFDFICRMASLDGNIFYGDCSSGYSSGWIEQTLDLSNVYSLGDLRGYTNVWVLIYFSSDSSVTYSYGALVDNVVLRKCTNAGGCASSGSAGEVVSGQNLVEFPLKLELNP